MPHFSFTPVITINSDDVPTVVPIKGQVPRQAYPFSLKDIYPLVPSLDILTAYNRIRKIFQELAPLLSKHISRSQGLTMPPVTTSVDALNVLAMLFDPENYLSDTIWNRLTSPPCHRDTLFRLDELKPFPLRLSSQAKLQHTLAWVDSNIKINVEKAAAFWNLPATIISRIVDSALTIYSLLLKQQDYWLANSVNFNFSMFIQDRILNLILGDYLLVNNLLKRRNYLSNKIALEFIKELGLQSSEDLCVAGIFMGVIWTSDENFQQKFIDNNDDIFTDIYSQIQFSKDKMVVNDINEFIIDLSIPENLIEIAVVLDDNGESVFDLAMFQQLLRELGNLSVSFIVNRFPVSNNISLETLLNLLTDEYFQDLARFKESNRVKIVMEDQVFRSFEPAYLRHETRRIISNAHGVYVKGANFFETFQLPESIAYHAFTVYGEMSMILTGFLQGSGIFARSPRGETCFAYYGPDDVTTLRDRIDARKGSKEH